MDPKKANGQTPLHLASLNGNTDICELLIQNGADLDERDDGERTPLHLGLNKCDFYF